VVAVGDDHGFAQIAQDRLEPRTVVLRLRVARVRGGACGFEVGCKGAPLGSGKSHGFAERGSRNREGKCKPEACAQQGCGKARRLAAAREAPIEAREQRQPERRAEQQTRDRKMRRRHAFLIAKKSARGDRAAPGLPRVAAGCYRLARWKTLPRRAAGRPFPYRC